MKKVKRTALFIATAFLLASNFLITNDSAIIGALMGVCLAIVFFLFADGINRYLINKRITSIPLNKNEQILMTEPSTYYTGNKGAAGKLFLTDKRVLFHKQAVLKANAPAPIEVSRKQIKQIVDYNRAMLPTGISILLKDGKQYIFAVDDREIWKEALG